MSAEKISRRKVELLKAVGYSGEYPMELLGRLDGYRDYSRRVVTEMVKEGLLKERKFVDGDRHMVRSLSITKAGVDALNEVDRQAAYDISNWVFTYPNGQGNWKKTLRLHRNAHCLQVAKDVGARWEPGREKYQSGPDTLAYESVYEIDRNSFADNKGSRASGVFFYNFNFYPVYYLGEHNILWNEETEKHLFSWISSMELYKCTSFGGCILVGKTWDLAEKLLAQGVIPNGRLIPIHPKRNLFYIADNPDGWALLKSLFTGHRMIEWHMYNLENRYLRTGLSAYEFDLRYLIKYYRKRRNHSPPQEAYVFPFQAEAMTKINRLGADIYVLPESLLAEYY